MLLRWRWFCFVEALLASLMPAPLPVIREEEEECSTYNESITDTMDESDCCLADLMDDVSA
jgi:hypothetical protein